MLLFTSAEADRLLGGGGLAQVLGVLVPAEAPSLRGPHSLVPIAEEVMAQLVDILILSVRNAREWLRKTELRLKDEGEESFIPGQGSGSHGPWFCWLLGQAEVGLPVM